MRKQPSKSTSKWGSFFGTIPTVEEPQEAPHSDDENEPGDRTLDRHVSGVSDQVVNVASDADNGAQNDVATGDGGKIKFKKAKKLKKKVGAEYSKALNNVTQSRFQDWSKMEMVLVLVDEGVELRNEAAIEKGSLRELCEALYFERDMPEKPPLPTLFDIIRMNAVARRIQNVWVIRQYERRNRAENSASEDYMRQMDGDEHGGGVDDMGFNEAELLYMAAPKQMVVGGNQIGGASTRMLGSDDANLLVNAAHQSDGAEGEGEGGDATVAVGNHNRKANNVLDTPWVRPDNTKAIRFADYVQPRKGGKGGTKFEFSKTTTGRHCCLGNMGEQLDLWEEGQISEFGIYGSGVTNYFKFIKWCTWLFTILAIIAIPIVILNNSGPHTGNNGLQRLARTTAGNLQSPYANSTDTLRIPGCNSYGVYNVDCDLNKSTLALFYSSLDIAIVCVAFVAFMWLRRFEVVEEHTLEKNTVNASMFTVTISSLPADLTEEELVEHLNTLCPQHKIANVSMAYDNAQEIEECAKRGDLIRAKIRSVHEHRHFCTKLKEKMGPEAAQEKIDKEREKFYLRMASMSAELKKKEEVLARFAETPAKPIFAFVTFDRAAGREACLETFNGNSYLYNYFYNQHYKLKGKWLAVEGSPEPSTILWENLAYDKWVSGRRRVLTSIIALLMILISLALIFSAKYLDQVNSNESAAVLCPADFSTYTLDEQRDYVEQNPDQLSCYCDKLDTFEQSSDSLCRRYLERNIASQVLTFFASLIVLLVNVLIEKVLRVLSSFEKHNSEDARGTSTFLRMFILKYINTTLVFFINNNNYILEKVFGVTTSTTVEFTADWFNTIGVTVILVQLGDVLSSHGDKFYKYFDYHRKKHLSRTKELALTQDELNMAQMGPEFEFAFSYAQLLSTFFCCFTFSTGIPILYVICAANYLVYYNVEKYLFIHLYRIPPHFSNNVGKRATAMLPYAFIIHLLMSIWVLSNKEIFDNNKVENGSSVVDTGGSPVQEKLTGQATFPLLVFLVIILALRIGTHVYKGSTNTITLLLTKCFGTRCTTSAAATKKKAASAMAVVTYTRAVQRNLIKGLSTYNILQNPKYKEQFAITWKFAMNNKSVRSVRNNKARAAEASDETDADKMEYMKRNHRASVQRSPKPMNRGFSASFYAKSGNNNEGTNNDDAGGPGDDQMLQAASEMNEEDNRSGFNGDFGGDVEMTNQGGQGYQEEGDFPVDPAEAEEQRRLYAQYQQQHQLAQQQHHQQNYQQQQHQQQHIMYQQQQQQQQLFQQQQIVQYQRIQQAQGRPISGGRSVNVMPLGMQQQRPASYAGQAGYHVVRAQNGQYAPVQGVPQARGVPYAQVMQRGGPVPMPQAYGVPVQQAQHMMPQPGPGRGGYVQVQGMPGRPVSAGQQYRPVPGQQPPQQQQRRVGPNGRPVDNDGFENADHLLYD